MVMTGLRGRLVERTIMIYLVRYAYRTMVDRDQIVQIASRGKVATSSDNDEEVWKRSWKLNVVSKVCILVESSPRNFNLL
jgi:hypothetical protein